jgi:thioredoxin-dependent peroxiredoxin
VTCAIPGLNFNLSVTFRRQHDSLKATKKFVQKHGLPFPLLSNSDQGIVKDYTVWAEKMTPEKQYMGSDRTTYVIDPDQKIKVIQKNVKAADHVTQLLKALDSLKSGKEGV